MPSTIALIHANVGRARHSLPYLAPAIKDHILMTAPLMAMGEPGCGIYGHALCTESEREALQRQRPQLVAPRQSLPGRVNIQSLIIIPEAAPASRHCCGLTAVVIASEAAARPLIQTKLAAIAADFADRGVILNGYCEEQLPPRLIQAIMQRGIVIAGKHPVTTNDFDPDTAFYLGELPGLIDAAAYAPRRDWDPFQAYLEARIAQLITEGRYQAGFSLPHANPFLIPYLPLMDEGGAEQPRTRQALTGLLGGFGPCQEEMTRLNKASEPQEPEVDLSCLSLKQGLRIRRQLAPLAENELPIVLWPPPKNRALSTLRLVRTKGLWHLEDLLEFSHPYAWVTLTWAALSGLIAGETLIRAADGLDLRPDAARRLSQLRPAILDGLELIVPSDHLEGSLACQGGRFFFQSEPFAALRSGKKTVLEIEQDIKRKAILDDKGLDHLKG